MMPTRCLLSHHGTGTALVGVLVRAPVLCRLHAAAAAPERVINAVHGRLLRAGQQEACRHRSGLVGIGIDLLEVLAAPREGEGSNQAHQEENLLIHFHSLLKGGN